MLGTVEFYQPQKMGEDRKTIPLTSRDETLHDLPGTVLVEQSIQQTKALELLGFAFRFFGDLHSLDRNLFGGFFSQASLVFGGKNLAGDCCRGLDH